MTRRTPPDPKMNKVIQHYIEGTEPNEKVLFIDTDNQIREAVYPSGYDSLQVVRDRIQSVGRLKAVVHISATVFSSPGGHGERTSVVEYLPDGEYYFTSYTPSHLTWGTSEEHRQAALNITQHLFARGEGEER